MNVVIIIPARLGSSRLNGKMLADIEGEPVIKRTWQKALGSRLASRVIVATDSEPIAEVMRAANAEVVMTSSAVCGTDRIAEVAATIEADLFVNLQGDEPLIGPETIDQAIQPFFQDNPPQCTTLICSIPESEWKYSEDPNVVKVAMNTRNEALYFSRSMIPYSREKLEGTRMYRHVGLYVFTPEILRVFTTLPPSRLELAESLEQLRLLENGYPILCIETDDDMPGVNTQEELEQVRAVFRSLLAQ